MPKGREWEYQDYRYRTRGTAQHSRESYAKARKSIKSRYKRSLMSKLKDKFRRRKRKPATTTRTRGVQARLRQAGISRKDMRSDVDRRKRGR